MKPLVSLATLVLGLVLLASASAAKAQTTKFEQGPTVADFFSDKALFVTGWSTDELEKILGDFASKYKDLFPHLKHVVFVSGGTHKVSLPADLPPDLLSFLVNYIHYPENFDLRGRTIAVVGIATLTRDFNAPAAEIGMKANFYIPSNDKDHDLVYIQVGAHTYEQSFTTMQWKRVAQPRMSKEAKALIP